jgi:protein phosphatase
MHLRVGAATSTGRVRELNEDAYMVRIGQGLFVVCDGMGGAPAGEVASQIAVSAIAEQFKAAERGDRAPQPDDERHYLPQTSRLADAVRRSNRRIHRQAQCEPAQAGMGTTVVSAWIGEHIASVAHVGDSRAYLWHDDRLEPLTRDHSLEEEQNVLVRVLGREPEVDVDLREVPLRPGDYLLLCSDGLTRMVPDGELSETIRRCREPQRICDRLIAAANRNGGSDNITVVVVQVTGGWWRQVVNRWRRAPGRGQNAKADAAV